MTCRQQHSHSKQTYSWHHKYNTWIVLKLTDDTLSTRANWFNILVSFEDGKCWVANLDGVERVWHHSGCIGLVCNLHTPDTRSTSNNSNSASYPYLEDKCNSFITVSNRQHLFSDHYVEWTTWFKVLFLYHCNIMVPVMLWKFSVT